MLQPQDGNVADDDAAELAMLLFFTASSNDVLKVHNLAKRGSGGNELPRRPCWRAGTHRPPSLPISCATTVFLIILSSRQSHICHTRAPYSICSRDGGGPFRSKDDKCFRAYRKPVMYNGALNNTETKELNPLLLCRLEWCNRLEGVSLNVS